MQKCEAFWPSDKFSPNSLRRFQQVENLTGGADFLGLPMFGSDFFFNAAGPKQIDKIL